MSHLSHMSIDELSEHFTTTMRASAIAGDEWNYPPTAPEDKQKLYTEVQACWDEFRARDAMAIANNVQVAVLETVRISDHQMDVLDALAVVIALCNRSDLSERELMALHTVKVAVHKYWDED